MHICGPYRFASGELTSNHCTPSRLMTSGDFKGQLTSYDPFPWDSKKKTTYRKKTIDFKDFREITIRITQGDVVTLQGTTYDGDEVETPVAGTIELHAVAPEWAEKAAKGEMDGVEIVSEDKPAQTQDQKKPQ